jgi:hypothetical protein
LCNGLDGVVVEPDGCGEGEIDGPVYGGNTLTILNACTAYMTDPSAAQLEPLNVRYLLVALTVDLVMGAQRPASSAQSVRDAMAT